MKLSQNQITTYLKEVQIEMSKVNWPTRNQALRLTLIVISASLLAGVFIGGLDFVFAKLITFLLR